MKSRFKSICGMVVLLSCLLPAMLFASEELTKNQYAQALTGTWAWQDNQCQEYITFSADDQSINCRLKVDGQKAEFTYTGHYEIDGNTLTVTYDCDDDSIDTTMTSFITSMTSDSMTVTTVYKGVSSTGTFNRVL